MTGHQANGGWVIWSSLFVALLLSITPLPTSFMFFRPLWCILFFIFWSLALPNRMSFLAAFIIGVFLDVMLDSLLGQHALVLIFTVYITLLFQSRIKPQPMIKQCLILMLILTMAQLMQLWLYILAGHRPDYTSFLFPILTSVIIWPWLSAALRALQIRMNVH